jgi:hypothetical protein
MIYIAQTPLSRGLTTYPVIRNMLNLPRGLVLRRKAMVLPRSFRGSELCTLFGLGLISVGPCFL